MDTQIQQLNQKLQEKLLEGTFPAEKMQTILQYIDNELTYQVAEESTNNLGKEEQQYLDTLQQKNATPEEIAAFLHLTEEEFISRYAKKLEVYVTNLSENLPVLKQQFLA